MVRPRPIAWPNQARICVTFIVPWEVWPANFATHQSLQRHGSHTIPPPNAVFKKNMAAITEREYGDRVGIWRLVELFERYKLKVTFLMNGLKVEQFPNEVKEFKALGHEFSSEGYEHEYSFMYTREQERESIEKTVMAFERVLGRALGWVITGQSLALVAGVPLVTLIGGFGGWRLAISAHATTALLGAVAVWLAVRALESLMARLTLPSEARPYARARPTESAARRPGR